MNPFCGAIAVTSLFGSNDQSKGCVDEFGNDLVEKVIDIGTIDFNRTTLDC